MLELRNEIEIIKAEELLLIKDKISDLGKKLEYYADERVRAKSYGDLRENSDFATLDRKTDQVGQELNTWFYFEKKTTIWDREIFSNKEEHIVRFGTRIKLKNNDQEMVIELTSKFKANPLEGQIYYKSPFALVLLGRKEGEEVLVPGFDKKYLIFSIKY